MAPRRTIYIPIIAPLERHSGGEPTGRSSKAQKEPQGGQSAGPASKQVSQPLEKVYSSGQRAEEAARRPQKAVSR